MKKLYIALTAVCMLAMTTEAQQRPGGGQGGPGGGFRGQGGPGGGFGDLFRGGGGREGIGELFRAMRDGQGETAVDRLTSGLARGGMTLNEAPTMRMSMFDVVERIGGARAQGILAQQLDRTARGAEIVHLDGNLERLAGDTYVDDILAAAKAVLANPPELDAGMRADARGTDALWDLLRKYEDDSFVDFAKEMLIDEDGGFHRQANDYLRRFFSDGIMQLYSEAYANPDLDDNTRGTIREEARRRMGQDPAANAIVVAQFTEYMNTLANPPAEPAEPAEGGERTRRPWERERNPVDSARRSARGYLESLAQLRDPSPESIAGRKGLLGSLRATTSDTEVIAMMDKVDERLTALSDPEKAKDLGRFSLGGRGGFSGFGRGGDQGRGRGGDQRRGPGVGQRPGGGKNQ